MHHRSLILLALGVSITFACGGAPPAKTLQKSAAPAPSVSAAPLSSLRRSGVKQRIAQGLGYFLQEVAVEDYPVIVGGKFRGFKIKAIAADWGGVDLRPGDVVTAVNGMSIEHPEDADAAFRSLEKAKGLRVDFDREGKPRTLDLPIVDD